MIRKILFTACLTFLVVITACAAPPALIKFKVPPHQKFSLLYKNTEAQEMMLVFSNEGDKDSVISLSIDLPIYTALYYGISIFKNNTAISLQNTLYLKNKDTVLLETDKEFQLVSKTRGNPTINPIIHSGTGYFSKTGKLFYDLQKEDINLYYKESEKMYLANRRRIDSIWNRKEIDAELKEILDEHAAIEYDMMVLTPLLINIQIPVAYAGQVKASRENLSTQPALVDNLDLQTALNLFNLHCRSEILKAGRSISLETLAAQSFKSKWSKPIVVAYIVQCLQGERKKNDAAFKATYQRLLKYAGAAYAPQLASLQKKYFPNINHMDEIIFLKDDGSSTTLLAELQRNKGRLIVIDFWASWCVPCRQAFPDLLKMRSKFSAKKVTFIGLSLDADAKTEAWITALKQEKLFGKPNQFKLKNIKISPLFDGLSIPSIPRYIVLSSEGKIINSDFYNPQQTEFAITLNKYLQQEHL